MINKINTLPVKEKNYSFRNRNRERTETCKLNSLNLLEELFKVGDEFQKSFGLNFSGA